jgi:hypothetical protein
MLQYAKSPEDLDNSAWETSTIHFNDYSAGSDISPAMAIRELCKDSIGTIFALVAR